MKKLSVRYNLNRREKDGSHLTGGIREETKTKGEAYNGQNEEHNGCPFDPNEYPPRYSVTGRATT